MIFKSEILFILNRFLQIFCFLLYLTYSIVFDSFYPYFFTKFSEFKLKIENIYRMLE